MVWAEHGSVHVLFSLDKEADIPRPKQDEKHGHQLENSLGNDVAPHQRGNQGLLPAVRLSLEEIGGGRLCGKSKSSEGIHDEVDPQQLHSVQRGTLPQEGTDKGHCERYNVDGQLELEEAADIVEHRASPHDCLHDGREVVIHDDDIRCLLRYFGATDTHAHTHISLLQSRGVIRAVTRHSHNLAKEAKAAHENELVGGSGAGKHLELGEHLILLFVAQYAEFGSSHGHTTVSENTTLARNALRSEDVVTRYHSDNDTRVLASLHCIRHFRTEGILDAHDAQADHVGLGIITKVFRVILTICKAEGTKTRVCHAVDVSFKLLHR
mmetsp:Transcript_26231/g.66709  ORF Transcript_26231/g.66709 Transcript_26231/m.66709 type:complete len:324 (+) Transcript_26231:1295-2266(+)